MLFFNNMLNLWENELSLKINFGLPEGSSFMVEASFCDYDGAKFFGDSGKAKKWLGWDPVASLEEILK